MQHGSVRQEGSTKAGRRDRSPNHATRRCRPRLLETGWRFASGGTQRCIVDDLRVVRPARLAWLQVTDSPRLIRITSYPLLYVGDAPQRHLLPAAPPAPLTGLR